MANIKGLSNIKQVFYRYELWEDFQSGMYNSRNDEQKIQNGIDKAIENGCSLVISDKKIKSINNINSFNDLI